MSSSQESFQARARDRRDRHQRAGLGAGAFSLSAPRSEYLCRNMPLDPGAILGSYQVTTKIGEGGMGEMYWTSAGIDDSHP